jgi:hypothetical protein
MRFRGKNRNSGDTILILARCLAEKFSGPGVAYVNFRWKDATPQRLPARAECSHPAAGRTRMSRTRKMETGHLFEREGGILLKVTNVATSALDAAVTGKIDGRGGADG